MSRKLRKNVGLIGLGIIGSRVGAALRQAGFHVYVWNRTPRAAPNFLASPAHVAELCDVIQVFVSDAHALFEVLDAIHDKLTGRHLVICSATVGPEATVEAAKIVEERGASFLDAPFTGSKAAAENRELVYYAGGEESVFKRAEPVLAASSKAIVRMGEVGHAATVKVATNMLAAVMVQTLAEALAIVKRSGIPPSLLVDAIEQHGVRSGVLDLKLGKMLQRDYEPHFSLKHMFKDVQLGIHIANSLDLDIPATTATAGVMYGGLNRGWADLDFSALAKVYETEAELAEPAQKPPASEPEREEPPLVGSTLPEPSKESLGQKIAPPRPAPAEPPVEKLPSAENTSTQVSSAPENDLVKTEGAEKTGSPAEEAVVSKKTAPAFNRLRRWFGPSAD